MSSILDFLGDFFGPEQSLIGLSPLIDLVDDIFRSIYYAILSFFFSLYDIAVSAGNYFLGFCQQHFYYTGFNFDFMYFVMGLPLLIISVRFTLKILKIIRG